MTLRTLVRSCLFFWMAGLSAVSMARDTDPPVQELLLVGATILDGAGNRSTGDILIRNGKIAQMGAIDAAADVPRIDAAGRWITPGIIDVHTHYGTFLLPFTTDSMSDVMERIGPNVAGTFIEHGVRPVDPAFSRALAAGVTTVQILPGSNALFGGRTVVVNPVPAVLIEDMRLPYAARGLKMACGSNPASRAADEGDRFPSSRQGQIAMIRADLTAAQAVMDAGDTASADANQQSLIAAMRGEAPVHLHCYRAEDIDNWLKVLTDFGIRDVTVHHASEAYKIAARLSRQNVCVATWSNWWGFKREAEDAIPENAAFIDAAGGCAIMHSDIPLIGSLLNLEAANAMAAGRRAGLDIPPERAIRWITSNAAKALGIEHRTGTLAPRMDADIVIWSGDPFSVYSKADQVIISGRLVIDRTQGIGAKPSDFELGRPAQEVAQ